MTTPPEPIDTISQLAPLTRELRNLLENRKEAMAKQPSSPWNLDGDCDDGAMESYRFDFRRWESDRVYLDAKIEKCRAAIDALLMVMAEWSPATTDIVSESCVRGMHARHLQERQDRQQ